MIKITFLKVAKLTKANKNGVWKKQPLKGSMSDFTFTCNK